MVAGVFQSFFAFLIGYVCGAIPFGLILTRSAGTTNLRAIGSGNIGATNVLRTGRKDLAALTLLLDLLKGTVAVLSVAHFAPGSAMLFAALGAFLGHLFPVWIGFKGGKGVATFLGCLLAAAWPAGLAFAIVWLVVAFLTRYSSAAALTASVLTPNRSRASWAKPPPPSCSASWRFFCGPSIAPNISRLLAGTESRDWEDLMDGPPLDSEAPAPLDDGERFDWLRLLRCENIGPRTFRVLLGDGMGVRARHSKLFQP